MGLDKYNEKCLKKSNIISVKRDRDNKDTQAK